MKKAINQAIKQIGQKVLGRGFGKTLGALFAIGLMIGSALLGSAQPVSASGLGGEVSLGGIALLSNAGGRELRNSIDDKMATEYGNKIDVNNTNIAAFRKHRGLYPTIAGKVVSNAPYDSVEDILDIPGLRQVEKDRIQQNLDVFTISAPDPALVEGADRFNNGVYK
ncbi:MAG: photosystem II complex extrinsic protein PsbU [Phormidesmis sp.]